MHYILVLVQVPGASFFQTQHFQMFHFLHPSLFPYNFSVFGLISSLSSRPVLLIPQIQALNLFSISSENDLLFSPKLNQVQ